MGDVLHLLDGQDIEIHGLDPAGQRLACSLGMGWIRRPPRVRNHTVTVLSELEAHGDARSSSGRDSTRARKPPDPLNGPGNHLEERFQGGRREPDRRP
jgi:hypothetical protein